MERHAALSPGFLRSEVERLRFGVTVPGEVPVRAAAGAGPGSSAASLLQGEGGATRKAGTPEQNPQEIPASVLERETGFEPATLSLGS